MSWIPQTELAELTGLSRSTLSEWARRPGCPKRVAAGRTEYDWPAWNEWRFEEGRKARTTPDMEDAKARKMDAEAELAEIQRDLERGRLISVDDAMREFDAALDRLRGVLIGFPNRIAHKLVGKKTIPEVAAVLDVAVHDLMGALVLAGTEGGEDA